MVRIGNRRDEREGSPGLGRRVGGEIETVGVAPIPEAVQPVPARSELGAARTAAAQRVEQMLSEATAALGVASPANGTPE